MSQLNKIFNKKVEAFAREKGLGVLRIKYTYYYVEDYEESVMILYKEGEDLTIDVGNTYNDPVLKYLFNMKDLPKLSIVPLCKYEDITLKVNGSDYGLLHSKSMELIKNNANVIYEKEILELMKEASNQMSEKSFKIEIGDLTVEQYDRLTEKSKEIEKYIYEMANEKDNIM